MRSILFGVAVALCATLSASAQTETAIGKLLTAVSQGDAKSAETAVSIALKSDDPRLRAVAARVANVRRMTPLAGAISALADREPDVNAAREELRAMVMLGGLRQVDRAFYISDRFSKRLDPEVATAAAHVGGAAAVDAYFAAMLKRNIDRYDFFLAALWNRPEAVPAVASRLLANDADGFETLLYMNRFEPRLLIDTNTLKAALVSTNLELRGDTVWYLLHQALKPNANLDPQLKDAVAAMRVPRDDASLIASVELLRRAIGLPHREFNEFRFALANDTTQVRIYLAPKNILNLMSEGERRAATALIGEDKEGQSINLPPFVLPSPLPEGMAAAIMSITGCREGWLGNAKVKIDESGYVTSRDLSSVSTSDACRRALDMLMQYSIVENSLITAPRQSDSVSLVRAASGPMCFDEARVASIPIAYVYGSPSMRLPRVSRRANVVWPAGVPKSSIDVVVETMVTAQGCVRAARLIKPAANAAVNAAALVAAQQWQFEPAMINTFPIDMLYDVTVEFRP
ncbi:MAG TPA: energy transducer TonB [Thermoanaerobaculia bacterium]